MLSHEGQVVAERQHGLVDHGHQVVGEPEYSVVHVQGGQLLLVDAHHVLALGGDQLLLNTTA